MDLTDQEQNLDTQSHSGMIETQELGEPFIRAIQWQYLHKSSTNCAVFWLFIVIQSIMGTILFCSTEHDRVLVIICTFNGI